MNKPITEDLKNVKELKNVLDGVVKARPWCRGDTSRKLSEDRAQTNHMKDLEEELSSRTEMARMLRQK